MIDLPLLDPLNYNLIAVIPINSIAETAIPAHLDITSTMLLKWNISQKDRGVELSQIDSGYLKAEVEIKGIGVLDSEIFAVQPSDARTKRVALITLNTQLPQKLSFISAIGVKNSTLEIYAFTGNNLPEYQETLNMGTKNPANTDPAALAAAILSVTPALADAIGAQTSQAVEAAMINDDNREESNRTTTSGITIKAWSGTIANHLIVVPDSRRIKVKLFHAGPANSQVFLGIGQPDGYAADKFDHILEKNGEYATDPGEKRLPVYAWLAPNKPDLVITRTVLMP
jgi:hypothetical protein